MTVECPKCQTDNPDESNFCMKCATPLPHEVDITEPFTKTLETPTEELTRGTIQREITKRKPLTSKGITVSFSLKKVFIPALGIAAVLIVVLFLWLPWSQKEVVPIPSEKPSLAILYFKNNTGDVGLEHWRSALCQWLITDLSQSKYINVLTEDRLYSILRRLNLLDAKSYASEDLEKVAAEGRVNYIFQASFSKAGSTFRIDYSLQKSDTLSSISSDFVNGVGEESFPSLVDELTRKIKTNLRLSAMEIANDVDIEIGKITTASFEAYKFYVEGWKYNNLGEYHLSIQFLEKAIAIDPEFAMAYRIMAACYLDLGNRPKWKESIQKALELSDRVSDRERYLIQGHFYSKSAATFDKAIDAFDKLLLLYPDDFIGNKNLANLFMSLEQWDKTIERYNITIDNEIESIWPYANISQAYMAKGLNEKAKEVLEYYIDNFSDNHVIRDRLAMNYYNQGKLDLALAEINEASSLNPVSFSIIKHKGDIFHYKGDFIKAEVEYQKLLESDEISDQLSYRAVLGALYLLQGRFIESKEIMKQGFELAEWGWFHLYLAYLHLKSGSPEYALEECLKELASATEIEISEEERLDLYFKGLIHLEMESISEAQKTADELEETTKKVMNKKLIKMHYLLEGMIELKRGNYPRAVEFSEKAVSLLSSQYSIDGDMHALYFEPLALSYYMAGDLEKSQKEYEKITSLTSGRLYWGDIYAKSFYMLGKIHERQGNTTKAIDNYEKFLNLWKDADPGLPEVDDAKKRLAGLK